MFQFESLNLLGKRYSQCFVSAEQQIQRVSSWHCYLQTVIHWLDLISEKMAKHDCTWHPDSLCCQKHPEYGASWIFRRIKLYQATQPDRKFCIFQSFMKWPFLRSHSDVRGCFWRPAPLLQVAPVPAQHPDLLVLQGRSRWHQRPSAGPQGSATHISTSGLPSLSTRCARWGTGCDYDHHPPCPLAYISIPVHSCKMPPSAIPGDPAG